MAKRYYICDAVDLPDGAGRAPACAEYPGVSYAAQYDNKGGSNRVLVLVETRDHTPLLKDPRCRELPEFPLDGKLNALRTGAQVAMNNMLRGLGFSQTWESLDGMRDVVRSVGKQLDDNFDENRFDVTVNY